MPSVGALHSEAKELGLTTQEDILNYVREQQNFHRDVRTAARRERAEEREKEAIARREEAERETETLRLREDREAETARVQAEIAERDRARAHQLEMARLQSDRSVEVPPSPRPSIQSPKLPSFRDGEDITNFLLQFDRIAKLMGIPEDQLAIHLGASLSGKALRIYTSLDESSVSHYETLKTQLLAGFNKNPESYRNEFRGRRLEEEETYRQFAVQLRRLLSLWIDSLGIDHTFESLFEFIIHDQFLTSVPIELRTFLKEQNARQFSKVLEVSDSWL